MSGCAHNSKLTTPYSQSEILPSPDSATVVFYRPYDYLTKGWEATVLVDGAIKGYLPHDGFFSIKLPAGEHKFEFDFPLLSELSTLRGEMLFENNQIYYIRASSALISSKKVSHSLGSVPEPFAKAQLKCCYLSQVIKGAK
jgi:hypothetical protein